MRNKNVSLAYCKENANIAKKLIQHLVNTNYNIEEYIGEDFHQKDSNSHLLVEFEQPVLLVVSDNFLKSTDCMYGALKMLQQLSNQNCIFPIIAEGRIWDEESQTFHYNTTSFEKVSNVIQYMNFWQERYLELRRQKRQISPEEEEKFNAKLKKIRSISSEVGEFLRHLRNLNFITFKQLENSQFDAFFKFMGDAKNLTTYHSNQDTTEETVLENALSHSSSVSNSSMDMITAFQNGVQESTALKTEDEAIEEAMEDIQQLNQLPDIQSIDFINTIENDKILVDTPMTTKDTTATNNETNVVNDKSNTEVLTEQKEEELNEKTATPKSSEDLILLEDIVSDIPKTSEVDVATETLSAEASMQALENIFSEEKTAQQPNPSTEENSTDLLEDVLKPEPTTSQEKEEDDDAFIESLLSWIDEDKPKPESNNIAENTDEDLKEEEEAVVNNINETIEEETLVLETSTDEDLNEEEETVDNNINETIEEETLVLETSTNEDLKEEEEAVDNNINETIEEETLVLETSTDEDLNEEEEETVDNNINETIEEETLVLETSTDEDLKEEEEAVDNNINETIEEETLVLETSTDEDLKEEEEEAVDNNINETIEEETLILETSTDEDLKEEEEEEEEEAVDNNINETIEEETPADDTKNNNVEIEELVAMASLATVTSPSETPELLDILPIISAAVASPDLTVAFLNTKNKTEPVVKKILEEKPGIIEKTIEQNSLETPDMEATPSELNLLFHQGLAAEENKDYKLAKKHYQKIAKLDSEYPAIYEKLGQLFLYHFVDAKKASKYFKKAIKAQPTNAELHYQYANLMYEYAEKPKKAAEHFKNTIKLQPEHPFANYDLALIYYQMGDKFRAHRAYLKAVQNNPQLKTAQNDKAFTYLPQVTTEEEANKFHALQKDIQKLEHLLMAKQQEEAKKAKPGTHKTVFITGATSGIGRATAELFAKNGYRLILTGRRKERLKVIKGYFKKNYKANIHTLPFDVRDLDAVKDALEGLADEWRQIDILINNAGLAKGISPIHEGDIEEWDTMIDTNIKGLLYMTRAIAPYMVRKKQGHIINVCSTSGKEVYPGGNVYCATKFAVDALTKAMRIDLHQHKIRVSQVSPAHVEETEFSTVRFNGDIKRANKVYEDFRPLTAKDVAEAIYFMANRPAHVNVLDVTLQGTQQASANHLDRSGR